jgi:hypothetical protein
MRSFITYAAEDSRVSPAINYKVQSIISITTMDQTQSSNRKKNIYEPVSFLNAKPKIAIFFPVIVLNMALTELKIESRSTMS